MIQRTARYGQNLYRVHVNDAIYASSTVYVDADSLTVTPAGALVLAIEVDPFEDLEETPDGTLIRKNPNAGIDLPPAAIFAPGQWYAALLIDHETKKPMFAYENPEDADHDDDDDE